MILILSIFRDEKYENLISKGNQLNDLVANKVEQVCFIIFVYLFVSIGKIKIFKLNYDVIPKQFDCIVENMDK